MHLRWIVAATAAVGAAALAAQFGAFDRSLAPSSDQPSSDSAAVQTRADQLFESFNGSQRQRNASGVLQAWSLNSPMDTCMSELGHPEWDWSALRNTAPPTDALGTSVWFKNPHGRAYSRAMFSTSAAIRAEEQARVEAPPPDQTKAIDACAGRVAPSSDDEAESVSTPEEVADLRSAWWGMLESWDARYGDATAYAECFARAQADDEGPAVPGDSWQSVLAQQLPPAKDVPVGDSAPVTEAWQAFLALEARLEQDDWSCRAEVYNDHLGDIARAIEDFAAEHRTEMEAAGRAWTEIEERAAELGFVGQPGSVDPDAPPSA